MSKRNLVDKIACNSAVFTCLKREALSVGAEHFVVARSLIRQVGAFHRHKNASQTKLDELSRIVVFVANVISGFNIYGGYNRLIFRRQSGLSHDYYNVKQ